MFKNLQKKYIYYIAIIALFILMNIFNTYFITSQVLNRYIAPVTRTFKGEVNAFFGNASILILFITIGFLIFKTEKARIRYLLIVTFTLNFLIFALGFFNLFYGTAFSINALDIFKNPSSGSIATGLGTELFKELIIYYRIFLFLPLVVIGVLFLLYKKEVKKDNNDIIVKRTPKNILSAFILFILTLSISTTVFVHDLNNSELNINSVTSTKGVQNYGVYPYYLTSFLGVNYQVSAKNQLDSKDNLNLNEEYNKVNKNKESYINIIDGLEYSNNTLVSDTDVIYHDSLNLNDNDSINGIFKDKNLVLVHLESLNHFLFEVPEIRSRFTFLNELLKESYVFNNFYTSVGLGVSADAEATVLTGLDMNGYETFYRWYHKRDLEIDTLPKLFNNQEYSTQALHSDLHDFYNRDVAYKELIGFSSPYISIERMMSKDGYNNTKEYMEYRKKGYLYEHYKHPEGINLVSPWLSEYELADITYEKKERFNDKHMTMSIYMTPHTPFLFNPFTNEGYSEFKKLNSITTKYIEFAKYIDETIEAFFIEPKTGLQRDLSNNIYVFYSDHGSSLKNGDIGRLLNKEQSLMEERRSLQQTTAFIYAPSNIPTGINGINKGLVVGEQNLTRGNLDLYRTIGDMFGLFSNDNMYFGVNGFSNEPNYVFDNRIQDVVIDDLNKEINNNYEPLILSLRNTKNRSYKDNINNESKIISNIIYNKKLYDLLLSNKDAYKDYKKSLQNE